MRTYLSVMILLFVSQNIFSQVIDYSDYNDVLRKHVFNGRVNYEELKNDDQFYKFLDYISTIDPDEIYDDADRMSFWINVYNAYTLKIVVDNYPIESITDLHTGGFYLSHVIGTTIWDKDLVIVNRMLTNLNFVEHEILRKEFSEPRIHFAIVCASIGCPALREEAFEGYKLEMQLTEQAENFVKDLSKNSFNTSTKIASISKIFDWFEEDFGNDDEEVLLYLSKYADYTIAEELRANASKWEIDYLEYNWELNK